MNNSKNIKCILIGDGGVGKTTFMKKHITGHFEKTYRCTQGIDIKPLSFFTNHGEIKFTLWDTPGQEKHGSLRDIYYINTHCAIIMFDVCSRITYKNIPLWYKDLKRICGDIPIIICGNKIDSKDRKINKNQILFAKKKKLLYFDLSVKCNFNINEPFLNFIKIFTNDQNAYFIKKPLLLSPEFILNITDKIDITLSDKMLIDENDKDE